MGGFAPWQRSVDAVSGRGPGARRLAREALLARGSHRRASVDAASGRRPPLGRWPQLGRRGCPRLEPDRYGGRRHRHPVHALAPVARRPVIRGVRPHGNGRLRHPAGGDGRPVGTLDQRAYGYLEVAAGEGRRGHRLRRGVRGFQRGAERRGGRVHAIRPRRLPGVLRLQHPGRFREHRRHWGIPSDLSPIPRDAQEIDGRKAARLCRQGRQVSERRLPWVFRRRRYGWHGAAQSRSGPVVRRPRELRAIHSRPADQAYPDGAR